MEEQKCIESLKRAGVKVDVSHKTLKTMRGSLSIKRLDIVDCLTRYHGWFAVWEEPRA